jgi:imidazolonepropionase-like amidohydrolase
VLSAQCRREWLRKSENITSYLYLQGVGLLESARERLAVGADAADFGLIAGDANHRALSRLVEAGWTPLEVIRLATSNGAELLGVSDSVGRIPLGWAADLIVVSGDPAKDIKELSKAEIVFKDGVGYDPAKLRAAARGLVGWH